MLNDARQGRNNQDDVADKSDDDSDTNCLEPTPVAISKICAVQWHNVAPVHVLALDSPSRCTSNEYTRRSRRFEDPLKHVVPILERQTRSQTQHRYGNPQEVFAG
jgi:hypothetical protein